MIIDTTYLKAHHAASSIWADTVCCLKANESFGMDKEGFVSKVEESKNCLLICLGE